MKRDEWILGAVLYALLLLAANSGPLSQALKDLHWDCPLSTTLIGSWTLSAAAHARQSVWPDGIAHWYRRILVLGERAERSLPVTRSKAWVHGSPAFPCGRRVPDGKTSQKG